MEIRPISPAIIRQKITDEAGQEQPTVVKSARKDSVEISSNARAQLADAASLAHTSEFVLSELDDSDKLEIIKLKAKTGFYERPEIRKHIAEKLIGNL